MTWSSVCPMSISGFNNICQSVSGKPSTFLHALFNFIAHCHPMKMYFWQDSWLWNLPVVHKITKHNYKFVCRKWANNGRGFWIVCSGILSTSHSIYTRGNLISNGSFCLLMRQEHIKIKHPFNFNCSIFHEYQMKSAVTHLCSSCWTKFCMENSRFELILNKKKREKNILPYRA